MSIEMISTDRAPGAIGPYSQAVCSGGVLYCSGQIALDPQTGQMVGQLAAEQAVQVLANLRAVLEAGGSSPKQVLKTTIFLASMDDFGAVNEVYGAFFGDHRPSRATVEVSGLPKGALVEIEAIAVAG